MKKIQEHFYFSSVFADHRVIFIIYFMWEAFGYIYNNNFNNTLQTLSKVKWWTEGFVWKTKSFEYYHI